MRPRPNAHERQDFARYLRQCTDAQVQGVDAEHNKALLRRYMERKMVDRATLEARFGKSEHGNFYVTDTIGVPHPYCITPKHVAVAADQFGGMLHAEAIEAAEKQGAHCGWGTRGYCTLPYSRHEQALLIECKLALESQQGQGTELHKYLLACKAKLDPPDEYAGFAFVPAQVTREMTDELTKITPPRSKP